MARVNNSKSVSKEKPAPKATQAKNNPVLATNRIDTNELQGPGETVVSFDAQGQKHVEDSEIEIENNLDNFGAKAAMLKFMEEPVTIHIAEATDKNQEKMVFCSVNGRGPGPGGTPYLPRGMDITVGRKYVEALVRARHERVHNKEVIKADGERGYEYPKTSSQMYPFQVVRDDNPKGRQWLSDLMRQR